MAQALIIHGNPIQAATLSPVLKLPGVDVEVAADSEWAAGRIDTGKFELVITPGPEFAQMVEQCAEESACRQSTEAALQDAEAMYRSFAEGLPIHLICKDLDGRFRFVNGSVCRELGKPLPEIVGKTDYDFFSKELAEKYRADDTRGAMTREMRQTVE